MAIWIRWALFCACSLAFLAGLKDYLRRSGDLSFYLAFGSAVLDGNPIYSEKLRGMSNWPPLYGLFCAPLALLERIGSFALVRACWLALLVGALLVILGALARMLYGRPFSIWPRPGSLGLDSPELLLPCLLSVVFLNDNFKFLQVNIIILALVLTGLRWTASGREGWGGGMIGLAAALKVVPGIFLLYFLYRGRWRAAAAMVVSGIVCSFAPALVFGWDRLLGYMAAWPQASRFGWGVNGPNQSILAMCSRFFDYPGGFIGAIALPPTWLPLVAGPAVMWASGAVDAILVAALIWGIPSRGPWNPRTVALESGAVLVAAMLLSPLAWLHYFVVCLVPIAAMIAMLRQGFVGRRYYLPFLGCLTAFAVLVFPSPSGLFRGWIATVWLNYSSVTLASLLLIAMTLVMRRAMRPVRAGAGQHSRR